MASVISEHESFQDVNGKPIVNGYIYVGAAGQDPKLNPVPIYSNREMTTPIANPQRTDSFGRSVNKIWVPERYSLKVEDSNNVQKLQDLQRGETSSAPTVNLINVQGINDVTAEAVPPVAAYQDKAVYVLTVVNSNTGAVTLDFGGGAKAVKKNNGADLVAGDWPAGSIQRVTYNAFSNRFDSITFSTVEVDAAIATLEEETRMLTRNVGEVFYLYDNLPGVSAPPKTSSDYKYIKLSAGISGAGGYNEGLLISESVTGVAPTITATAVIDLAGSPINGQTVNLINTEKRYLRAGIPGTKYNSAIESHNHTTTVTTRRYGSTASTGFGYSYDGQSQAVTPPETGTTGTAGSFANETRTRTLEITAYMRIK